MTFLKLTDNFELPPDIMSSINKPETINTSTTIFINGNPMPLEQGPIELWQSYNPPKNILFLRNWKDDITRFYVIKKLKILQQFLLETEPRTELLDIFLNLNFKHTAVGPVKVIGPVDPHADITRKYALTIGVKNSNHYRTYTSTDSKSNSANFDYNDQLSYIVNDGDVYITRVDTLHAVVPVFADTTCSRYTLSYSIE